MASAMYDRGREAFLGKEIGWDDDDFRVILIDTAQYTVNTSTHTSLSDVPAGARIAVTSSLGSKTITNGVADAGDITFNSVTGSFGALLIYLHTGTDSTSRLVCYIDGVTNFPGSLTNGTVNITWDNGANKIFKL